MLMVNSIGFTQLDVDGNELISMRVYPSRNILTSESFFKGVLKYCDGELEFVVDNAPWLKEALKNPWASPSPPNPWNEKPNGISLLVIQTENKNLLQQDNSKPKTQNGFKDGKGL